MLFEVSRRVSDGYQADVVHDVELGVAGEVSGSSVQRHREGVPPPGRMCRLLSPSSGKVLSRAMTSRAASRANQLCDGEPLSAYASFISLA